MYVLYFTRALLVGAPRPACTRNKLSAAGMENSENYTRVIGRQRRREEAFIIYYVCGTEGVLLV